MMQEKQRRYRRDCWLGALGALLMLVGDLCLSVIPASAGDSGLFQREAYFTGAYPGWRLPLLVGTGLLGMALCFFAVRVCVHQVLPRHRKLWQLLGCTVSTWDFVLSQGSGNAALLIWMTANALWAGRHPDGEEGNV